MIDKLISKFWDKSITTQLMGLFLLSFVFMSLTIIGIAWVTMTSILHHLTLGEDGTILMTGGWSLFFGIKQIIFMMFGIVLLTFIAVFAYQNSYQISHRLVDLAQRMEKVSEGDLTVKFPLAEDEIGLISENFNRVIEEVRLLNLDFDNTVSQLEIAEIAVYDTLKELKIEKEKVEETSEKLEEANEEISLLNEKLKIENIGLNAELKAINDRLNQFLEAVPVGIIVFDDQGETYYTNDKAQKLLGKALSIDYHNTKITEFYPIYISHTKKPCPPEQQLGVHALQTGQSFTHSHLEIHTLERVIPIESWETPIFDHQGRITYAIVAFQDITDRKKAEQEKLEFTEKLLHLNKANERFVPRQFLQLLEKESITEVHLGDNIQQEMTVLFSDIRGFTTMSEKMSPEDNFKFINAFLSRMAPSISAHNGFIDKYIGDAIMALFSRSADDAVQAGIAMLRTLSVYNLTRQRPDRPPLKIGIGINTGSMMLGTVGGTNRMEGTVISDAVNLASRLEHLTKRYQSSLLISNHTMNRLEQRERYHIRYIDRVKVQGKSIEVEVYEVFNADRLRIQQQKQRTKPFLEEGVKLYHARKIKEAEKRFNTCFQIYPDDPVCRIYLSRCAKQRYPASDPVGYDEDNLGDMKKL